MSKNQFLPLEKISSDITSSVLFSVPVGSIKEVRSGKTTEALKNKEIAGIYPDECAFSIVFGDNFESMDLIANTPDEANIWVTGLTCLINTHTTGSMTCMYFRLQQNVITHDALRNLYD